MKMEGGYHGSYEAAQVSLVPLLGRCGDIEAPISLPADDSIPESVLRDVIVCPYNEPELAANLIDRQASELAAVIVEPILGSMGMVPAKPEFLQALRDATERAGAVLIFDEVISFRLGDGGAQSRHGIAPDLTALGKIIGGGLPIGAVGGRRDLMERFDPASKRDQEVGNARQALAAMLEAGPLGRALHLGMLRHGVASASRLMYCVSTPMGEADVEFAVGALEAALQELRPLIERDHPGLLA